MPCLRRMQAQRCVACVVRGWCAAPAQAAKPAAGRAVYPASPSTPPCRPPATAAGSTYCPSVKFYSSGHHLPRLEDEGCPGGQAPCIQREGRPGREASRSAAPASACCRQQAEAAACKQASHAPRSLPCPPPPPPPPPSRTPCGPLIAGTLPCPCKGEQEQCLAVDAGTIDIPPGNTTVVQVGARGRGAVRGVCAGGKVRWDCTVPHVGGRWQEQRCAEGGRYRGHIGRQPEPHRLAATPAPSPPPHPPPVRHQHPAAGHPSAHQRHPVCLPVPHPGRRGGVQGGDELARGRLLCTLRGGCCAHCGQRAVQTFPTGGHACGGYTPPPPRPLAHLPIHPLTLPPAAGARP